MMHGQKNIQALTYCLCNRDKLRLRWRINGS